MENITVPNNSKITRYTDKQIPPRLAHKDTPKLIKNEITFSDLQ